MNGRAGPCLTGSLGAATSPFYLSCPSRSLPLTKPLVPAPPPPAAAPGCTSRAAGSPGPGSASSAPPQTASAPRLAGSGGRRAGKGAGRRGSGAAQGGELAQGGAVLPRRCCPAPAPSLAQGQPSPRFDSSSQYPAGLRWLRRPSDCGTGGTAGGAAAAVSAHRTAACRQPAAEQLHLLADAATRHRQLHAQHACATSRKPPARRTAATRSGRPAAASSVARGISRMPMRASRLSGGGCVNGSSSRLQA